MSREQPRKWLCVCGATVEVWHFGDTACDKCGQPYNGFGQRLRRDYASNPSNWDEEIGDMEGYEISQLRAERE